MSGGLAPLQEYARSRSAEAFAELVSRHAGMVFGTGLRITGSPHDAEDVAQECFFELARRAGAVSSPAGWLHATATRRSLEAIRKAGARRRHEEQAMSSKADGETEPTWAEMAPHVDRVLEELADDLRAPVVMHYLEGRSQAEIAAELGVNQSTVSRKLEKGVAELREKLRKAGVVASVAMLGALLSENALAAAPASLMAALGKMAVAGIGAAGATAGASAGGAASVLTAAAAFVATVKGKVVVALVIAIVAAGGVVACKVATEPEEKLTSRWTSAVSVGGLRSAADWRGDCLCAVPVGDTSTGRGDFR